MAKANKLFLNHDYLSKQSLKRKNKLFLLILGMNFFKIIPVPNVCITRKYNNIVVLLQAVPSRRDRLQRLVAHMVLERKQSLKVRLSLKMPFRLYDFNQGEGCTFNKKIAIVIAVPLVIIILLIIIFTVLRHVNPELLEDLNNRSKNKRQ